MNAAANPTVPDPSGATLKVLAARADVPAQSPHIAALRSALLADVQAGPLRSWENQALFLGIEDGHWTELQALFVPEGRFMATVVQRTNTLASAFAAAMAADNLTRSGAPHGAGTFIIGNSLVSGVEQRSPAHEWHYLQKGDGTSDGDIARRRFILIDIDPTRPSGISATDEELHAALDLAEVIYEMVVAEIGVACVGFGVSGNGAQIYIAVDVAATDSVTKNVQVLLAALDALYTTNAAKIDTAVADARRLIPFFGTVKRKGVPSAERPHRRSVFTRADDVQYLREEDLVRFCERLFKRLSNDAQTAIAKKLKLSQAPRSTHSPVPSAVASPSPRPAAGSSSPFVVANNVPVRDVLAWLEALDGEHPICPGCKRSGDSSYAIVGNGVKCSHASCSSKGINGFFTVVDVVAEMKNCTPLEAVKLLDAEFSLGLTFAASNSATSWPEPLPLDEKVDLPDFPAWALPPVLGDYVDALAVETQTPVDLPAMLVLAVLSLALARKFQAVVRPGWFEALALYVVVALGSGNRKSAVFDSVTVPVEQHERSLVPGHRQRVAAATTDRARLQAELKEKSENARKTKSPAEWDDVSKLQEQLDGITIPPVPRLIIDDATPEALAVVMGAQSECIGVMSDEGGFLETLAGRYNDGTPNVDLFLKAYGGADARIDRVNRTPIIIPKATLAVALAVQPVVVEDLGKKPGFRERGLLARLAMVFPASFVGRRQPNPPPVRPELAKAYYDRVRSLLELPVAVVDGHVSPRPLAFDPPARAALEAYAAALEPLLAPGNELGDLADVGSKHTGRVARVAALLHLVEAPDDHVVHLDAVQRAITIGEYLIPHAKHAFRVLAGAGENTRAKRVLDWIKREKILSFTQREAFEKTKGTLIPNVAALETALATLVAHEHIRLRGGAPEGKRGRPKGPEYEVNPRVHATVGTTP